MIDLNRKPQPEKEESLGMVMLGVLPFCLMIAWGVIHAL